ncbi:MAG: class I SAM-dependent methyltransferase [Pseudomonadota bacterium]
MNKSERIQEQPGEHTAAGAVELTAKMEPFDSFWEAPENIDKGYERFYQFYRRNYLRHMPADRNSRILVVSCGPGYFVKTLSRHGYKNILGIDSYEEKVAYAREKNLNCRVARVFPFLADKRDSFDAIFCEQELNHLTKDEMVEFLKLIWQSLASEGTLIVHGLNGANPITGSEALSQNFDHYNTFTEYSVRQVLEYSGYKNISVFPLNLYVFYRNPLNYAAWGASVLLSLFFRTCFILYGKSNKIFTKKIAAACVKSASG